LKYPTVHSLGICGVWCMPMRLVCWVIAYIL
jgi:hypothetical protein